MKFNFFVLCLMLGTRSFLAQSFEKGNLILTGNYGGPNVSVQLKEKWYNERNRYGPPGSKSDFKNYNRVYSLRCEYAVANKWSLGISVAYWDFDVHHKSDYVHTSPGGHRESFIDDSKYHVSSMALGVRTNYILFKEQKINWYAGCALGITYRRVAHQDLINSTSGYADDFSDFFKFLGPNGIYFAPTVGLRYYPFPYLGTNLEVGFDHGALLLAGITTKINTRKKTSAKNENN